MYQSVGLTDFHNAFFAHERQDQFSSEGRQALFEYLCEMEYDTSVEIELDVIALCCEYAEYDSIEEACDDCGIETDGLTDDEMTKALENRTTVINVNGSNVIIQQF